jgi:hypothetical protein
LGFDKSNASQLHEQVLKNLPKAEAIVTGYDGHGQRYQVDVKTLGVNGKTVGVRTAWIIRPVTTAPDLISIYVKE